MQSHTYTIKGNEHGVVAIRPIHEHFLVSAVFSNGEFILRKVDNEEDIKLNLKDEQNLSDQFGKDTKVVLTNAKIAYTCLRDNKVMVGLAIEVQEMKN